MCITKNYLLNNKNSTIVLINNIFNKRCPCRVGHHFYMEIKPMIQVCVSHIAKLPNFYFILYFIP